MSNALDPIATAQQDGTSAYGYAGFGQGGQRSVQHVGVDFACCRAKGV
jgi:hypothetical protein